MKNLFHYLYVIISIPVVIIAFLQKCAIYIATPRWYLWGFIPCSVGLWPLGLYLWNRPSQGIYNILLKFFSLLCLVMGTILFFAGLWRFAFILLAIRLLLWLDTWLNLSEEIPQHTASDTKGIFRHPLDAYVICLIVFFLLILIINKDRLIDKREPSDHFYHMAVAQQILEQKQIPLWDDWEFAPFGRPHLYPPFLHLVIAYFAGVPENVMNGFATVQILLYPFALFTHWILYRYLLGPPMAYLSLIVLTMQFMFGIGCLLALPASLVNAIIPLIIVAVLKRQRWIATILVALTFYTHTGIPIMICLSLLCFGVWRREYFLQSLFIICGAIILSTPWTMRYIIFADWMHTSGPKGFSIASIMGRVLWLQILNPTFIVLALWGWYRSKDRNLIILKSHAIGFLPMLTQYGGRFFMHASPFLAPLIAWPFRNIFTNPITKRKAIALLFITLIPLPSIQFMEMEHKGITFMPNITATHYALFVLLNREPVDTEQLDTLLETISHTTDEDEIIHLPDAHHHFGNLINVMVNRRTDNGGWGEVSKSEMWEAIKKSREDFRHGTFIANDKTNIPEGYKIEQCGDYYIGYPQP